MSVDQNDRSSPSESPSQSLPASEPCAPPGSASAPDAAQRAAGEQLPVEGTGPGVQDAQASAGADAVQPSEVGSDDASAAAIRRRRILIGSQRDPAAYRPKPKHDWAPVDKRKGARRRDRQAQPGQPSDGPASAATPRSPAPSASGAAEMPLAAPGGPLAPSQELQSSLAPSEASSGAFTADIEASELESAELPAQGDQAGLPGAPARPRSLPPPSRRDRLTPDLEAELNQAMGDVAMDDVMRTGDAIASQGTLEPESHHRGKVLAIQRDDVFVELGSREQGVLPVRQFETPPEPGTEIEVVVSRFNAEEGLYDLVLPHASVSIGDWSDLSEGIVVEARVTGVNTGGLECEVNHIRGFIPISQVSLYRVEDLAQFVDQKLPCVVTEANPERRNLVLSHRAVLERQREEAREAMLESLAPGQLREGVIRKITDFGAFVDLGSGVDGLLHISQMSWARIKHPSEMFQEGQPIKVRVEKFDQETGRISLSYRDMLENPWTNVDSKYPPRTPVHGKVTRLMEFGAFVQLEPGVEGLVHISELSRKHVRRVNEVVKEGDEVDVLVLSVDPQAKRISLSMKDLLPPEPEAAEAMPAAPSEPPPPPKPPKKPSVPLRGGLGRVPGAKRFGLKW